jgi:hypothetical protein
VVHTHKKNGRLIQEQIWLRGQLCQYRMKIPHGSDRKIRTFRRLEFTVSAGCLRMEPAGEAEAGNAGVQPAKE